MKCKPTRNKPRLPSEPASSSAGLDRELEMSADEMMAEIAQASRQAKAERRRRAQRARHSLGLQFSLS